MNFLRRRFPEILLAVSIAILFYPLLMGQVIFWGVPSLQFYPWRKMAFSMLRQGQLPLWNPLLGNGAPLLANYQTGVFYLPNWLDLLLPTEYTMGWLGMLHIFWAGLGMMAYLRRLGVSRFGQGIGGLAFALNSYLITRFSFLSITFAVAWLGWLLWAIEGLWSDDSNPKWRPVAILGGVAAMQLLAGHAQTTVYSLELTGAYALWRALRRQQARRLLWALAGMLLGAGIAAIQLLPTLELMLTSQRSAGVDFDFAMRYSYWPWRFLTWLLPDLFGNPSTANRYWGYGVYWEDATFVGLICLMLAFRAAIIWLRQRRAPIDEQLPALDAVPFFLIVLPVTFILALGKNTPIFVWLFRHVPTFDLFQAPARWMLLAVFSVAALGGIGAQGWQLSERGTYWTRLSVAGGVSMFVTALYAHSQLGGIIQPSFTISFARLSISVAIFAAAVLFMPTPDAPRGSLWQNAMLALAAIDLVSAHWGFNPVIDPGFYRASSPLTQIVEANPGARTFYLPDDEQTAKFTTFINLSDFGPRSLDPWLPYREALLPNMGMLDWVPSANNFDPLLIGTHAALMESLVETTPNEALPRLRAMNVGVLLATQQSYGDLDLIARNGEVSAYSVPDPLPRAYLVSEAHWVGGTPAAVAAFAAPNFDPAREVILEQGDGPPLSESSSAPQAGSDTSPGEATVLRDNSGEITIAIQADQPAWLVLTDSWYPGWRATLDGEAVAQYRANVAFRAMRVPSGTHTLTFAYRPRSVWWGAVVSAVALAIGFALSMNLPSSLWTKRGQPNTPPG